MKFTPSFDAASSHMNALVGQWCPGTRQVHPCCSTWSLLPLWTEHGHHADFFLWALSVKCGIIEVQNVICQDPILPQYWNLQLLLRTCSSPGSYTSHGHNCTPPRTCCLQKNIRSPEASGYKIPVFALKLFILLVLQTLASSSLAGIQYFSHWKSTTRCWA